MASKLPKAERAIIASHEAGMHDRKPIPATCRSCAMDASAQAAFGDLLVIAPPPKVRRKPAKPATIGALGQPPAAVEVPGVGTPEKADPIIPDDVYTPPGMGFSTDVHRDREAGTREEWMLQAVATMRGWFPEDSPIPEVRVSIGWPAGRGTSRVIGQCFHNTADKAPALFVAPSLSDPLDILETLLHETIHAAVGAGQGHKGKFVKVAKGLGFMGPWTSTPTTTALRATLKDLALNLGDFPHAAVTKGDGTRPAVQGTRMLKVECRDCGCIIRMTSKWIEQVGVPTCGCGGEMKGAA